MSRALVAALVLTAIGCKKKETNQFDPPPVDPQRGTEKPQAPPDVTIAPLPPAQVGPAYLSIWGKGIARLEPDGWKLIAPMSAALAANGDAVYGVSQQMIYKLDGATFVERSSPGAMTGYAVTADGVLWVIAGGKLQHLDGTAWVVEALPGDDPPRGIAATPDGLWVRTLDRTYRRRDGTWTAIDVPAVTGTEHDILSLATNGADAYLATGTAIFKFDGTTWASLPLRRKVDLGGAASVIAGPGGRYAVNTGGGAKLIGDVWRGLRPLDIGGTGLQPHMIYLHAIDDRGRTWGAASGAVLVFDEAGALVKKWSREEDPLFDATFVDIVVTRGGPVHLGAGERAAGTVTGKVEGSAAGIEISACATAGPTYLTSDPCADAPNARQTKTIAGGRFTLEGVSLGPTYFWVKRGGRWRETEDTGCCNQLAPDGTLDVGTLRFK